MEILDAIRQRRKQLEAELTVCAWAEEHADLAAHLGELRKTRDAQQATNDADMQAAAKRAGDAHIEFENARTSRETVLARLDAAIATKQARSDELDAAIARKEEQHESAKTKHAAFLQSVGA